MININTIYILNKLSYILYKKKKEESKRRKKKLRLSRVWLLGLIYDPFFSFILIIIMKNMYLKGEGDFEYEGEMKSACQCIVPKCRNCQPRFYQLRPHRVIEL